MLWNILASHLQECCLGACPMLLSVLCIINMNFTHNFGNMKSNKKQDLTNRVSVLLLWFAFGWKTASLILVNDKVHCHDKELTCKAKARLQQCTFSVKCSWMCMWDYWLTVCSTGRCMVHNTFNVRTDKQIIFITFECVGLPFYGKMMRQWCTGGLVP